MLTLGDIRLPFGDTFRTPAAAQVRGLIRSASLATFSEVARDAGLDPRAMLREFDLPPRSLTEPELRVPVDSVRRLLETSAERSSAKRTNASIAGHAANNPAARG